MQTHRLPVVDCPIEARARGQAHGEALRAVIGAKIERWHAAIGEAYGQPAEPFLARFLGATDFRPAIAAHTPDLLEEIAGIAEGAGIAEETAYALQLMDEEWWFGRGPGSGHCSSVAVAPAGGRPTLVGQTMDLPRWHDEAQALLRIAEADGAETMVFTTAGMVGLMGVSSCGIGICVNTLIDLAYSPTGLPVACVMRGALARPGLGEASAFLASVPHASGQTYQLGDRTGVRTFECSAGGAAELDHTNGRCLHTNHPLVSRDLRPDSLAERGTSRGRLSSLDQDLSAAAVAAPGVDDVKVALSARRAGGAVSVEAPQEAPLTASMTVGAVVYEIGDTVELSAAAGPPSREAWRRFSLRPA